MGRGEGGGIGGTGREGATINNSRRVNSAFDGESVLAVRERALACLLPLRDSSNYKALHRDDDGW